MNSPFANIFLAIQQRIQNNVTGINYIDQDLGQLKNDRNTTRPNISFPCVLIDFEDFNFEDIAENAQTANATIVLRLGLAPFSNSSQVTPTGYIASAISYYDLEWSLHKAIQGWSPIDDTGYMMRTEVATQKRNDTIRVREIRYSLAFEDYSTANNIQRVSEPVHISPQIQLPL